MPDRFARPDDQRQPWESDADAWREIAHAPAPLAEPWPQLSAGPAYWMWLALLEEEHRLDG